MFYIECSSEVLGANIECTVEHRIVRIFNVEAVPAG